MDEILDICQALQRSLDGRWQLLLLEPRPVYAIEPTVSLNIRNSLPLIAQSLSGQLLAQMSNQMLCEFGYPGGHVNDIDAAEYVLINLDLIDAPERSFAHKQLVDQDAQCPVVHSTIVSAIQNDLGCHILGSAGKSIRLLIGTHILGKAKVNLWKKRRVNQLQTNKIIRKIDSFIKERNLKLYNDWKEENT